MTARLRSTGRARRSLGRARGQRGIVLIVALIVLVVMTLAGLAMMRQVSGSVSIAGNMAFKEVATSEADVGTEQGRNWLLGQNSATLSADSDVDGYKATYVDWGNDPAAFDWAAIGHLVNTPVGTGNVVKFIVQRLCQAPGPSDATSCSDVKATPAGGSRIGGEQQFTTPPSPFYRITTQVKGPRNTTSYIQVVTK